MAITKEQAKALERRDMENVKLIHHKLDHITTVSEENRRSLRGSNGDTGMVADMGVIKPMVVSMNVVMNGNPDDKDDVGMVGEQKILKTAYSESQDNRKWMNRLVIGFMVVVILEFVVSNIIVGG